MVANIARCFAKAGLLDIGLAKRTKGYYIETHNLLTIATPTGLPEKPAFRNDDSGTYAIYHRADWKVVAKILVEDVIRPAGWSRSADNIPNQYPCFGFFGFCLELANSSQLTDWAITNCTTGLYKIGKGQLPAGLIATCRTPKIAKHMGE